MARGYAERSLIEFQRTFASEEACAEHLARHRWPEGFVCPQCGHRSGWYLPRRHLFDCRRCRHQTSLTGGTVFHKTRTPLVKWYWLIYHLAMDQGGVSVAQLQRALEIPDYKTAWLMAHKVRKARADRDAGYRLVGLVELEEAFFGPPGKTHGRGSEAKTTVWCAVSLYRDQAGRERPGFAHLTLVADASTPSIGGVLERLGCGPATAEGRRLLAAIRTDGWRAYGSAAKANGLQHCRVVLRHAADAGRLLPWVHRVLSNAKAVIRGAHRGVSSHHLQSYLGEICYRFNRRFWEKELFDRLIRACVSTGTITYDELTHDSGPASKIRS